MFTGRIHAIKALKDLIYHEATIIESPLIAGNKVCSIGLREAKEFVDEVWDSASAAAREAKSDDTIHDWLLVSTDRKQMTTFVDYNEKDAQSCAINWLSEHGKIGVGYRICRIVADMALEVSVHSKSR